MNMNKIKKIKLDRDEAERKKVADYIKNYKKLIINYICNGKQ